MAARLSEIGLRFREARRLLEWRALRVRAGRCPLCGLTLFVRLSHDPLGVRCLRCAAWPVSMAMAEVVATLPGSLAAARVYEASAAGPWVAYLARQAGELVVSEYLEDAAPGSSQDGVLCQDLERLTFPDAAFDLCTSTEVFEHVADDAAAFREVLRVLKPGGFVVLTVPLFDRPRTRERATRWPAGEIHHLLEPEFHGDRLRGAGQVLVYREYGLDIVDRLGAAGFVEAEIRAVRDASGFGHRPRVVVARRPD